MSEQATIVLVHGAFADASGWTAVITSLQDEGYTALAPANPLRGLPADSAYIRSVLDTIEGPVVLAGHSYGGAVLTNAAHGADNVKALVYIAAFALDEGENVAGAGELAGDKVGLLDVAILRPFPDAGEGNADAYINPEVFAQVFCQDLPADLAAAMASSQRPGALASLVQPSGVPAWKSIPSWFLVASSDRVIPPGAQRLMAERAGSTVTEIDSSHVAMISHPDETTAVILDAARAAVA